MNSSGIGWPTNDEHFSDWLLHAALQFLFAGEHLPAQKTQVK